MKRTKEEILRDAGLYQADSFDRYFADRVLDAMEEYAKECMPKWISVETSLPEVGEKVLICRYSDNILMGKLMNNGWCGFFIDKFDFADGVTHWQKLPEPPTE